MEWNEARINAEKGKHPEGADALFEDWTIENIETAWRVWTFLDSIEWKHLPDPGGILDQDEHLMTDIATLARMSSLVREELKANNAGS
jgi:hypothetical protein